MIEVTKEPEKFPLGQLVATRAIAAALDPEVVTALVRRHESGDWGELDSSDKEANDRAVGSGERILSHYTVGIAPLSLFELTESASVYVITEWDRSVTTVLFTGEY